MYKKILVPLDGSALAQAALKHAVPLARETGAHIVLLQVVVFPTQDFDVIPMEYAVSAEVIAAVQHELEHIAGDIRRLGVGVTTHVATGRVADSIVDFASEREIDLIVMSTHGRTGPLRWLLGSVADKVVHHAPMPVLLIRSQMKGR